jgi:hypothetical protein
MNLKDKVEIITHGIAIIGGLIAAYKVLIELKQSRIQRHQDLRWKQANAARELLKEMLASKSATDATIMIDWTGREFQMKDERKTTITFEEIQNALRIDNLLFTSKEAYIRDCADAFLFHIELIEQAIRNELIEFKDIKFPMEYYISAMKKNDLYNAYYSFIKEYNYKNSERFFGRFNGKLKGGKMN